MCYSFPRFVRAKVIHVAKRSLIRAKFVLSVQECNLKCCENCTCGTKKAACKNKGVVVVVNRNPSAFARFQEEQANAEREIKVSRKFCDTKFCSSHQSHVMMS